MLIIPTLAYVDPHNMIQEPLQLQLFYRGMDGVLSVGRTCPRYASKSLSPFISFARRSELPSPKLAWKLIEGPIWRTVVLEGAPLNFYVNLGEGKEP